MIDKVLDILAKNIHEYLKHLPDLNVTSQETIYLTHIAKNDGSLGIPDKSLGLTLVNIEEERVMKSQKAFMPSANGCISHINPEIKVNLYILITAYFTDNTNYATGLKFLSGVIRFFQSKNVFTSQNTPDLDPTIQKLIVELYTLDFEQQHHLWGLLGAKYLPSVMYKVRMITIQEAQAADEQLTIQHIISSERNM